MEENQNFQLVNTALFNLWQSGGYLEDFNFAVFVLGAVWQGIPGVKRLVGK